MTDKEKLDICTEFIRKIETLYIPEEDIYDLVSITGTCNECGSDDVEINSNVPIFMIDPQNITDLKDEAWHVLATITE